MLNFNNKIINKIFNISKNIKNYKNNYVFYNKLNYKNNNLFFYNNNYNKYHNKLNIINNKYFIRSFSYSNNENLEKKLFEKLNSSP